MNINEKIALLNYMEFHLVSLCEQVIPHLSPDAVGSLYDAAYGVLCDLDETITLTNTNPTSKNTDS